MKIKGRWYLLLFLSFYFLSFDNWALSQNPVINQRITKVGEKIYVLNDNGVNISVMVGHDDLLIIDTGYEDDAFKTDSIIRTISTLPIRYILNTHLHFDHVGGNKILSEEEAVIVANENTRQRMLSEWNMPEILGIKVPVTPPYPEEYLPKICFQDSLKVYFNNEIIKCIHFPTSHSDSDAIYYFPAANLICTGDLFVSDGFAIVDSYSGGTIDGYINAVDNILRICNERTVIIPGHGAVSNRQGLQDYLYMLVESRTRIASLINEGKTVDEVIAADPTKDLFKGVIETLPPRFFVYSVYQDLAKK
jgi:cyclase